MVVCSICGSKRRTQYHIVDGEIVCVDCYNTNVVRCYRCGHISLKKNSKYSDYYYFCQNCYNSFKECDICGEKHYKTYKIKVNNEEITTCKMCMTEIYFYCDYCKKWHLKSDNYITIYNSKICLQCADKYFQKCDCGKYHNKTETLNIIILHDNTTRKICRYCSGKYFKCNHCHKWYLRNEISVYSSDQGYICPTCYEQANTYCERCETVLFNQVYTDNGNNYCHECYNYIMRNLIAQYSYKPSPKFLTYSDVDIPIFAGIELEVDKGQNNYNTAKQIRNICGDKLYMKFDGSLSSGFEIVSHPATYPFHYHKMEWEKVLKTCIDNGYTSHDANTCGLHVHIGREAFGENREQNISKLLIFFENNWDNIVKFSRRKLEQVERWASRYGRTSTEKPIELLYKAQKGGRYRAVNLQCGPTIEIRVFRGTLRYLTFLATLQFTDCLMDIVKESTMDEIESANFNTIMQIASLKNYSPLKQYIVEKRLVNVLNAPEISIDPDASF